ncbi:glycosyltransferase [Nitratifractor sp.]
MKKIKLFFAIRSLDFGGAERQFIELVKHIDKNHFEVTVCTMYGGEQEEEIKAVEGIRYFNLQKKGRYDFFRFYRNYRALLQGIRPQLIYSFLGEMNLYSLWCKPTDSQIIWGFRASNMDLSKYGRVSRLLFRLQRRFSNRVDKIIANSGASVAFHGEQGFCMKQAVVIPNGIDTERFRQDERMREEFRRSHGLENGDIAVGIVARIDHMKGYPLFAVAAAALLRRYPNLKFFAVGDGDRKIKEQCEAILGDFSKERFVWLGRRREVEEVYNGLDIAVSSSLGEGFSNSIAEAMACGVPCIATDVGDSALIVGECGIVIAPGSEEALVEGVEKMMRSDLKQLGRCARERIVENFSIENMVKKTESEIRKCVES